MEVGKMQSTFDPKEVANFEHGVWSLVGREPPQ